MLWLLHEHHILPGTYYRLPEGEKALIHLLFGVIMEARSDT